MCSLPQLSHPFYKLRFHCVLLPNSFVLMHRPLSKSWSQISNYLLTFNLGCLTQTTYPGSSEQSSVQHPVYCNSDSTVRLILIFFLFPYHFLFQSSSTCYPLSQLSVLPQIVLLTPFLSYSNQSYPSLPVHFQNIKLLSTHLLTSIPW